MAKRKTQIDKAIEVIDADIAKLEHDIVVLRAARTRLQWQQREPEATGVDGTAPTTAKSKHGPNGHPEGGRGI